MTRSLDPKKIKSAQRALEVLEYFQNGRTEATVMDIARSMGYPQSSTSELLGCLVALGYLTRDRAARSYRPTARVAVLGAWVKPTLFRQGRLLPIMDELAEDAQATIVLGSRVGLHVQYIHAVRPNGKHCTDIAEGSNGSLAHSAVGKVLLAAMDRTHMRKLMHRLNAELDAPLRAVFEPLAKECDQVHAQRYAAAAEGEDRRMLAVLLPQAYDEEQLALGMVISASQFDAQREHYVQMLRGAAARLSSPRPQPATAAPVRRFEDAKIPMMA